MLHPTSNFFPDTYVLDFETYYDSEYSLSKMTTEEYIRDPRFEVIMCGVIHVVNGVAVSREVLRPNEFAAWVKTIPWEQVAVLTHHAQFDGRILAYHYNVFPGFWYDTLSMARALHGVTASASLKNLMTSYAVGNKGNTVHDMKGRSYASLSQFEWDRYAVYCLNDCEGAFSILEKMLRRGFPRWELDHIDTTVRMFTEPVLVLDEPQMKDYFEYEIARKAELLASLQLDRSELMSDNKFAALLMDQGVTPPTKWSTKKKTEIFAFAKTDPGMQELLEYNGGGEIQNAIVQVLAEARLAHKSTINITRTERLLRLGKCGAAMPVYLRYAGAHTMRWSGGDGMNWQNFERTNKKDPMKGKIRRCIRAPPGWTLAVADSAQIEARVLAWLAEHVELVEAFASNRDVYSEMATKIYGRPIDRKKVAADEIPGHVGKTCLAAGTLVVTDKGLIPIEQVTQAHRLWDGEEWACHRGLLSKGWKPTVQLCGLSLTPDHLVWSGTSWAPAQVLAQSVDVRSKALAFAAAHSSSLGTSLGNAAGPIGSSFGATAAGTSLSSTGGTLSPGELRGATSAPSAPRRNGGRPTAATLLICRMAQAALVCWTACRQLLAAATGRLTLLTSTMACAASPFATSGVTAVERFCGMFKHSLVGTTPPWRWTVPTTTTGTGRGISGLSRGRTTRSTNGRLPTSSSASATSKPESNSLRSTTPTSQRVLPVFDLVDAGPRHRFTVMTDAGPLIVSNCTLGLGYGMGWKKFAQTLIAGPLGAPPIVFTQDDADSMGVNVAAFKSRKGMGNQSCEDIALSIPSRLTDEQKVIHCAVACHVVDVYRKSNPAIVDFWAACDEMLGMMCSLPEGEHMSLGCISVVKGGIMLPSGLTLHYPELHWSESSQAYVYKNRYGFTKLYGGLLCENITQALARVAVSDQIHPMVEVGYKVANMTHDEVMLCVPEALGAEALAFALKCMKTTPDWAAGLPLNAEGHCAPVYGDAK